MIGDKDLATNLFRNQMLHEGKTLTEITNEIKSEFNILCEIIPMTDDKVSTKLITKQGERLDFQNYFVQKKGKPRLKNITYNGSNQAKVSSKLIRTIRESDTIIIGPSNPYLSIGPILSLRKIKDALIQHDNVIVISPFINNNAIKGPSKKKVSSDKTDDQLFNEANTYNRLHRNDNDVKVKEEKIKISKDLEKKKGILRKTINEKLENEKKKYEEEVSKYTKEKEEFESMKQKAIEEIMEKENVNKYKASLRFKEEYEKHIQYTLVIKEIMQHSNCSQEEAENLFKQISLQKSQMKEGVSQIENEQYSDEPIPE